MSRLRSAAALSLVLLTGALGACGSGASDEGQEGTAEYDSGLLAAYRAALPEAEQVQVVVPGGEPAANAITALGDAEIARLAIASAISVNVPALTVVTVLRAITSVPPTLYDSEQKEFVWGPWANDQGYGQVMAFIRENPEGDDMKYEYALIRLVGSDLATMTPVIWGSATPGTVGDGLGVGITLWDFEADNAFTERHDPEFDASEARNQGRFAMLYGRDRGENDDGDFSFNVAVFRNFIAEDADPGTDAANLDYFYGHFAADSGSTIDFVDWALEANLCEQDPATCFETPADGEAETMTLRAAFIDRGMGRAEAVVGSGDLLDPVSVLECWDDDIDRTHLGVESGGSLVAEVGACEAPFDVSLASLGVPTMAELDQEVLASMDCIATNGIEACEG